jgi:hypothetical protein
MLAEREVALRLARNMDVVRKLRIACKSRFFWFYSLSLWDPEAFWKCVSGAGVFAVVAFLLMRVTVVRFATLPLTATVMFEYFLMGLILMWLYNLGPWIHPTNFKVILTFIFRLYRKNKSVDDLSAYDIGSLFPPQTEDLAFTFRGVQSSRTFARIERSSFLGPLFLGSIFAFVLTALLMLTS